jgi:hypothetical protein
MPEIAEIANIAGTARTAKPVMTLGVWLILAIARNPSGLDWDEGTDAILSANQSRVHMFVVTHRLSCPIATALQLRTILGPESRRGGQGYSTPSEADLSSWIGKTPESP